MPVSINDQTIVFLSCIGAGLAMGLIYDIFSGIRKGFSLGKGMVFLLDSIFWMIGVAVFFGAIYSTSGGDARWYVFLGMFLGLLFYLFSVSHFVLPKVTRAVCLSRELFIRFLRVILYPVRLLLRFLSKMSKPASNIVQIVRNKLRNFVKKNVEMFRRIVIILRKV